MPLKGSHNFYLPCVLQSLIKTLIAWPMVHGSWNSFFFSRRLGFFLRVFLPLRKQPSFIQIEKTFAPPLSQVKNEPHLMADLPNNCSIHRNIPALSAHSCCLLRIITCVLKGKLVELVRLTWWNSWKYNKTKWMYINHEWGLWLEAKMSIFVPKTGWVVSAFEKIAC